jgi:hypothetical protein
MKINPIKWRETSDISRLYILNFEDELFHTVFGYKFRFILRGDIVTITGWKNESVSVDYVLSKNMLSFFYDSKAVLNFILNDMILKLDDAFSVLINE